MTGERSIRRGSKVARALSRLRNCLQGVLASSQIVGQLRRLPVRRPWGSTPDEATATEGDQTTAEQRETTTDERRWSVPTSSRIWNAGASVLGGLASATRGSRLFGVTARLQRFVEASWLYRWLTAEPDPDVVVIDLRETLTVGPWLAAIERAVRWLLPAAASSVLLRLGRGTAALVHARPVQMLSLLVGSGATAGLVLTTAAGEPSRSVVAVLSLGVVFAVLGSREDRSWTEVRESRWVQLLAGAFEPPEPPTPPEELDETASEEDGAGSPADTEERVATSSADEDDTNAT